MIPDIISKNGENYAVIPYQFYQKLMEDAEMFADIQAYDIAKNKLEESFPSDLVYCLVLEQENPVKIFREYRNLSLEELANKTNISIDLLKNIEEDINLASSDHLISIALTLNIDMDLLIS